MPKSPTPPKIRLTPQVSRAIAAIRDSDMREAQDQPRPARLFLTFDAALIECRAVAATGFMSHAPRVRLEKALAWAADLANAELIPADCHVLLRAAIRARAKEGRL